MFSVACRTTSLLNEAYEKFSKTIGVLFEDAFVNLTGAGQYYDDNFYFAAIVPIEKQKNADTGQFFAEKISGPALQLVKNIRQYFDVNTFIGVSSLGKIDDCSLLLREAHQARFDCFFSQKVFVGIYNKNSGSKETSGSKKTALVSYEKLVD